LFGVALTTQFFAEYTDVDAVIVLAENDNSPEYTAMLYGVTKLQISWNMPVLIGDCRVASEVADMVAMQNEMEAAAPEHISPDKKSIN
jgi:ABC-type tungstate transport system permease subunit